MDYTITKIICTTCERVIDPSYPCLEVSQTKWVNGYHTTEVESIYFCQDCCADGIEIKSKKDFR